MSKQVKDILATHDTGYPHGITFAIHQQNDVSHRRRVEGCVC